MVGSRRGPRVSRFPYRVFFVSLVGGVVIRLADMSHRRSPRLSAPSSPALHRTEVEDGEGSHTTRESSADPGPATDGGPDVQLFGDEDAESQNEADGGTDNGPSATAENEAGSGEGASG